MKSSLYVLLVFILVLGCSPPTPKKIIPETSEIIDKCVLRSYTKSTELDFYMKKHVPFTLKKGDTLFFVPLGSCASCVAMTLDALLMNNFSGKIILGGNPSDYSEFNDRLSKIQKNEHFVDSISFMYQYDLEVVSPTILIIDNKRKARFAQLSFDNWKCISKNLNWKLPDEAYVKH